MRKILFIAKQRTLISSDPTDWNSCYSTNTSTGLYNSISFIINMFEKNRKYEAKFVQVVDNNCIDREVSLFKPDIVIIEALWVVPEKFPVLQNLHPSVKWVVRLHSNTPFLALEGIAIQWLKGYLSNNVKIAVNSDKLQRDLSYILKERVYLLPNYYLP